MPVPVPRAIKIFPRRQPQIHLPQSVPTRKNRFPTAASASCPKFPRICNPSSTALPQNWCNHRREEAAELTPRPEILRGIVPVEALRIHRTPIRKMHRKMRLRHSPERRQATPPKLRGSPTPRIPRFHPPPQPRLRAWPPWLLQLLHTPPRIPRALPPALRMPSRTPLRRTTRAQARCHCRFRLLCPLHSTMW